MEPIGSDWQPGPSRPLLGEEVHVWRSEAGGPSRGALRRVLAAYLGCEPQAVELREGEHGKPELGGGGPLRFNLSHSGAVTLIAVCAEREVGVDVELAKPRRNLVAIAERELGSEAAAVRAAPEAERAAVFYRAWTRHEARLKCLGVGLWAPPPAAPVAVESLPVGAGYAAALAVAGEAMPACRRYTLSLAE